MRDRHLSHESILARFEREVAVISAENERAFKELRACLVDKYGEDGVARVEAKVVADREKDYERFIGWNR